MEKKLITRKEFAEYFKITLRCELLWRKYKRIPIYKIGRRVYYSTEDVNKFLESFKKK